MARPFLIFSTMALVLTMATTTFSVEPAIGAGPVWGTVVKASADSITIQPAPVPATKRTPLVRRAEQTHVLSNNTVRQFARVGERILTE